MARSGSIRILVYLLAFSAVLNAQQYVFRTFRQPEGLANLAVNAMATDRQGFLWLATENGVFRFLGSGFERFGSEQGIGDLDTIDLLVDPNGTIWVATEENLYRLEGQRFFPAGRDPIHVLGPRRLAVEDAHHLLVVDNMRLYRLEHDAEGRMLSYRPVFPDSVVAAMPDLAKVSSLSVVAGPSNGERVWIGCGRNLYSWHESQTNGRPQASEYGVTAWGGDKGLAGDQWESVLRARDGTLWAAGQHHVAVLPPGATCFADRSIPGSDPDGTYGHAPLVEDPEGRMLAPTEDGIARWNGTGWRIIGRGNGLECDGHITSLVFDAAGDLWFSSLGGGLYNWAGYADWEGWGDKQGLPSSVVWAFAPWSADRLFVGTQRGPAWIDLRNGLAHSMPSRQRWACNQIAETGVDRDASLWVATRSGEILRIDSRTGRAELTARLPSDVSSGFEDSSGRLFVGTRQGLFVRESAKARGASSLSPGRKAGALHFVLHRIPAADALKGDSTRVPASCESSDGVDWFAVGSHLVRLKEGRWTAPSIEGISKQKGDMIALSCAKGGVLWIVDAQGSTWRLSPSGDQLQAWQLKLPPELSSLEPLAILVDRRGWIWLGTDLGLVVWNGNGWRHLTQESGLIWNDISQGAMSEAPDGSLWIGTSGGLAHLRHPERVFDSIPLTVSLTQIQRGETSYIGAQRITIPWAGPSLRFQLSSPTMRNRSELVLKVQMTGLQQWVDTKDGIAAFPRLFPGKYTFMAMACNLGLDACSAPVKVGVEVLPPWWRSYWFYGSCILVLLCFLMAVDRFYGRHLHAKRRQLEKLVEERTQELEASRAQLHIQATHDGLTGMLNRTAVMQALATEMDRARREKRVFVVALVDLDHFKRINDTYGHLAGDEALRWFAAAVGGAIRSYDHAGRYGGEEFMLVLTEVPRAAAEQRLASLHASITNLQVSMRTGRFTLNCSMGATVFDPSDGYTTVETLLTTADLALYAAKAEGRNRVVCRLPGCLKGSQNT
jgi:diguanylate cyclase (GGDEF)-like protein